MKKINFLLAFFCLVSFAVAQNPNFSGTWTLNTTKSQLFEQFSIAPVKIIIQQEGNDLKIEKHSSFQGQEFTSKDVFTLDGIDCINPGIQGVEKKSVATWSEDKLALKIVSKMSTTGEMGDIVVNEVFKMKDGNMIIDVAASSSMGEMSETEVYDKL